MLQCLLCFGNEASRDRYVGLSVGLSVGRSVGFDTTFKKVWVTLCEVYNIVQTVYTGWGPGTAHVYTESLAGHSEE